MGDQQADGSAARRPPDLTIAIPTYERRGTVVTTVRQFRSACAGLAVRVMVADNASGDGTVAALQAEASGTTGGVALDVIAGEDNRGILGNFLRLAEHCSTSHLLLLSDEEGPTGPAVYGDLLERLGRRPDTVLVPAPSRNSGRALDGPIAPEDLWDATNYLSGIVYPVAGLRAGLAAIAGVADREDIAAIWRLWPFYLVVVEMMLQGGACRWTPQDLYVRRERLPTTVEDELFPAVADAAVIAVPSRDPLRARYKSLEARLAQSSALATYLAARSEVPSELARPDLLARFEQDLQRKVFPTVRKRLAVEHPLLVPGFDRGAVARFGLGSLLRDPLRALRGRGLRRWVRRG